MTLGVVMLVHTAFGRAEQVVRHWSAAGCPVVVHVDAKVPRPQYDAFTQAVADLPQVRFSRRHSCEWGTWGLVAATQAATTLMLDQFAEVRHVYLASGSCLPLRPIAELRAYLDARATTDFIESATTADVPWTIGGLHEERFTLRFPFSWKRNRRLFDKYVEFQRKLGLTRRIPAGIEPHIGSQWWCLTRQTLTAILGDPNRRAYDRYFRRVWIPDESYFQTLARLWSRRIESRSLTMSKFDFQGKPHIFYDDHLELLRRSDCFVARKIWPDADGLYRAFLDHPIAPSTAEPNPAKVDRIFANAVRQRTEGRPGLYMQSRFPNENWENGMTAGPYTVFQGFGDVLVDFETWLARHTSGRVHGHLFGKTRAEFEDRQPVFAGALTDTAKLRDYNPTSFLRALLWSTRGEQQMFQFGPRDAQTIGPELAKDPNATINVVTGAWAVRLFHSNRDFTSLRTEAARLQQIEADHLDDLRAPWAAAHLRVWTLAEFVENPLPVLQAILDDDAGKDRPIAAPRLADLQGFGQFLQNLKNQGMHPYLVGDFTEDVQTPRKKSTAPRPYVVR